MLKEIMESFMKMVFIILVRIFFRNSRIKVNTIPNKSISPFKDLWESKVFLNGKGCRIQ